MLHRLLFDASNATDSANVGAHVRAGDDGTLIGHVSDALKVNFSNTTIAVTATDLDIRNLSAAQDNVAISDGTDTLAINADGSVNITDNGGSLTVDATNLDIRDLTHVTDSVKIGDGTDFLAIDASGNIGVTDAGGSLTVDAVNLDIRDLTAASDSVKSFLADGAGTNLTSTLVSSKQALDVYVANEIQVEDDLANTALAVEAAAVTTSSAALITTPLAARRFVWLYNNGSKVVYIGPSGVTTGTGFPIFAGSIMDGLRIGAANAIHAVSASGTQEIRVLQAS